MSDGKPDDAAEVPNGAKAWVTILTACLSVGSAIYVAVITQSTSARIAELQVGVQQSSIAVQQNTLKDQQDARRQQFLKDDVPKLLSKDESEQRAAQLLLRVFYPDDAGDILRSMYPSGNVEKAFTAAVDQADQTRKETGDWVIVIATDKSINLPKIWSANATKLGYTPAFIYLRDGLYQTTVGAYPNRQRAEEAVIAIRPITRPDAFVVAVGRWCPNPRPSQENGVQILVCANR